jgi:hypothetical protein
MNGAGEQEKCCVYVRDLPGSVMKIARLIRKSTYFGGALCCGFLVGCVSERQYRTQSQPEEYNPKETKDSQAIIEVAPNYTMGFVEFDDQGWMYGSEGNSQRQQIDTVLDRFSAEGETNGLLMVTFVHGWKHNADSNDGNVLMFHHVLRELGTMEEVLSKKQHHPPRRVVGLYVGWHGLSADIEPFEELSFWDRKNTAEVVGHGAAIQLLSQLEALRNQINRKFEGEIASHQRMTTKLMIIGHSFGGDIVFSAVSPMLMERMVENHDGAGVPQSPKTLEDLVVLINPAFEAARFEPLERLAATKSFPPGTNCTLAVFTSTADWATGLAFPIGREVSTVFESYVDRQQAKANVIAVGHYAPYISYELNILDKNAKAKTMLVSTNEATPSDSVDSILSMRDKIQRFSTQRVVTTNELTYDFTHCQLAPTTNCVHNDPVFNVAVAPAIIPNHDDIDRGVFIRFLAEFLFAFSSGGEK